MFVLQVTDENEIKNALNIVAEKYKTLNLVVNCAGIGFAKRTVDFKRKTAHPLKDFQKVLEVVFFIGFGSLWLFEIALVVPNFSLCLFLTGKYYRNIQCY